jgi:hypothetical protein
MNIGGVEGYAWLPIPALLLFCAQQKYLAVLPTHGTIFSSG